MEAGLAAAASRRWTALTKPDSPAPTITTSETFGTDIVVASGFQLRRDEEREETREGQLANHEP